MVPFPLCLHISNSDLSIEDVVEALHLVDLHLVDLHIARECADVWHTLLWDDDAVMRILCSQASACQYHVARDTHLLTYC